MRSLRSRSFAQKRERESARSQSARLSCSFSLSLSLLYIRFGACFFHFSIFFFFVLFCTFQLAQRLRSQRRNAELSSLRPAYKLNRRAPELNPPLTIISIPIAGHFPYKTFRNKANVTQTRARNRECNNSNKLRYIIKYQISSSR